MSTRKSRAQNPSNQVDSTTSLQIADPAHKSDAPPDPESNGDPTPTIPMPGADGSPPVDAQKPPTASLAARARRTRDYKAEGGSYSRQMEVTLRATPYPRVFFRAWPDPADYWEVALYRPPTEGNSRDRPIFVVDPMIADLDHVKDKVKNGLLVPCVTTNQIVFVWAFTIPDPDNRMAYRTHEPLERIQVESRGTWVGVDWNPLRIVHPRRPIATQPRWPKGQSLTELYSIAIRNAYIDTPDHPEILKLDTIETPLQREEEDS
jgi:hypothetical protein